MIFSFWRSSADLRVHKGVNHCDGVLSDYWNTLLGQQISQDTEICLDVA